MTVIQEKDLVSHSGRMAFRASGGKWGQIAVRLRVLRSALFRENTSAFARRLKVSQQRLSNMENGFPLSIDVAFKIKQMAPGITLDWLYEGEERAVPMEMLTRLRDEAAKPDYIPPPNAPPIKTRPKAR